MMTMTFSINRSYGLHISASRSLNDEPKKRNFIRIQFRRWYAYNIKCFKLERSWKRQKTVTAAPADKPWMTEKDKNQLLFCLHTFTFYDDRSLSSIILQWLNATRRCWSISPLNGFHHIMQMIQSGQYFTEGLSYTSVRMTGSNFGNFFNGALKDFEAKQASRIRVRVWEFPWVIFLKNV